MLVLVMMFGFVFHEMRAQNLDTHEDRGSRIMFDWLLKSLNYRNFSPIGLVLPTLNPDHLPPLVAARAPFTQF